MAEQARRAFSDADSSESDELIVATEHLGFVRDLIGSRISRISDNRHLGLAKLDFSTKEAAKDLRKSIKATAGAGEVRAALVNQAAALATAVRGSTAEADPIGTIVTDLRALAAALHGGWMPTIGRNRQVVFPGSDALTTTGKTSYGVGVTGKTSYGGGGLPRALSTAKNWNPPSVRQAGQGRGVRVGMVDTKIWSHPWLAGGWVARPSQVMPDGPVPGLAAGHGTFVAGLILSQAPGAVVEVRSGLGDDGRGTAWDAAEAIVDLGRSGVDVINLSFSCYTGDGQAPLALARAVDRVNSDIVVVAAAGNHAALGDGEDPGTSDLARLAALPSWPAALDDVVAVGALDRHGSPADFSPERPWVDLATRGVALRSTYPAYASVGGYPVPFGDGWAEWSGTSFAAALVSGAIAAGIDPGRLPATEVAADLLSSARSHPEPGATHRPGGPPRLGLRIAGWARGSKSSTG